jgi:tetratricopeptide (TPR) repeat protein
VNRKTWAIVMSLGLLVALALFAISQESDLPNPFSAREDPCAQGKALNSARLLDEARETYDGAGECEKSGLEQVERAQDDADQHFALAGVYATASGTDPAKRSPANSKNAIANYELGLLRDPFDADANAALKLELDKRALAQPEQCETAASLADAGLLTDAGAALANGLAATGKGCDAALEKVAEKRQAAARLQAEAIDFEHSGQIAKARTRYAQALRANANLAAAKSGLESSLVDETGIDAAQSWLTGIPDTLKGWLDWLIPLAVGLLLVALGVWIGVREWSARVPRARKAFERLGGHPGLSFFHKAAVPDVSIEDFDGKGEGDLEGAAFSTMLAAAMGKQVGREPSFPLDRIGGSRAPETAEATSAADVLAEVPATKLVGSLFKLISKLFRRRTIVISGRLAPDADQGAGVLLALEGNGRTIADSITLWERAYDPKPGGKGAARWLRLVPAAAVWARWHLATAHAWPGQVKTESWRAEAFFLSADAWLAKGDRARAEALYAQALEFDQSLLPAIRSLARIEIYNGAYAPAGQRLKRLRTIIEAGGPDPVSDQPLRELWPLLDTASLYTLVLALAYPAIEKEAPSDGDRANLGEAIEKAQVLVRKLAAGAAGHTDDDDSVREQMVAAEGPSVVVLAALQVRQPEADRAAAVGHAVNRGEGVAEISRDRLRSPAGLDPWDLIHGYVEKQHGLSRRTNYNLACYYTTLAGYATGEQKARCFELALVTLEAGLVGGELSDWAAKDPSLGPLREDRPYKEKFEKIVKAHTIAPHEEPEKEAKDKPADPKPDSGLAEKLKKAIEDWLDPDE